MKRKPTMNDVARLAGVGTMTVSRVLNRSAHVSDETSARVAKAIEKLGYRPNEAARTLRGQKSRTIGIIAPYLYDPFFAMCAHAINLVARERDYSVILTTSNEDAETEYAEAQLMLHRRVDGLIVIPASDGRSRLTLPEFNSVPIVAIDRPLLDFDAQPSELQPNRFDSVVVENRRGTELAIQHLIAVHGHARIAFVALNQEMYTFQRRYEGYQRAMLSAELEPLAMLLCPTPETATTVLLDALAHEHPPTALFTANTLSTRYALHALINAGIRVPRDIALAAFDDFDMAETLEPRLTVVQQSAENMGQAAASLLFDKIAHHRHPREGSRIMLPVELIVRDSCGCAR